MRRLSRSPGAAAAGVLAAAALAVAGMSAPALAAGKAALVTAPATLVNPFIGTSNQADDFPGADVPFGMVQWSPDTPSRPDGGGYEYNDSSITGFSLTHIAGPGCGAAGDVPVLPTVGAVSTGANDSFAHANESASAGSYKVTLDNKVTTELTATTRSGMARFTFPSTTQANLVFKLNGSQNGDSSTQFNVVSSTEVSGQVTSGHFCGAGNTYTVYFDMVFDQPFTTSGTPAAKPNEAAPTTRGASKNSAEKPNEPVLHGSSPKAAKSVSPDAAASNGYVTFNATAHPVVQAKVGVSYVSIANATANRAAENTGWDFDATRTAAQNAWNAELGKVQIGGGTAAQQQSFYTALYHSLLHPNVISDTNGQYFGFDGKTHTVDSGHKAVYANYSGWDIYRSQAQLEGLIDPQAASDTAQSMVDDYAQTGVFPKWSEDNGESYVMVGDPADAIIADYYAFGARNFDTATALKDLAAQASKANNDRPGLNYLTAPGYMPHDGSYGCCNFYGPVATTLEYDTADFALSALAGALGDTANQRTYAERAQDWRNVLDPDSGFVQPRNGDGTWTGGFDPTSGTDMVEADSWIYTGMVPFDIAGLARAKGGNAAMNDYLDTVLRSFTGDNGYAWVGNEPSIELPWEYDYTGAPYKTQGTVRAIQDAIWSNTPGGLADGNDDLGAMSAWYVWAALGMYPETPGTSDLALGSPLFTQAVVTLPGGGTLTVNGNGAADNAPYVQSASWNGSAWNNAYAPTTAITSGGTLSFTLGTTANTSWATGSSSAPPSYAGDTDAPPTPRIGAISSGVDKTLCVDDATSGTADGTHVQIWGCDGTYAQDWLVAADGTLRTLGKCLDVVKSGTTNGTLVQLYTCNGTGAQQWTPGANGSLVNPESNLCLDDPNASTSNGTQLQIYTCNGSAAQNWTLPAAPAVRHGAVTAGVGSGLCLDDKSAATDDGTPIEIWSCNSTSAQDLTVAPDGTLRILGSCLDASNSGTSNGTLVQLYHCNGSGAQQWHATTASQLINTHSGLCLDDPNSSTTQGTQLQLYACNGSGAQQWHLPS
ncbi:lectin [Actinacidiphila guanduensis]|uniref:Alpha-1,2-mannosidase, putative n=1 Tax=Actinacidiphila guanduensis TaxID=310781 RepID=A0A1G9Y1X8_9ACTN|nr:lectin [Actinacidiphila guanduensis]SDN03020.1 alpha-1,2-mannosidase, putative [Actinacidiphila guanduensis]